MLSCDYYMNSPLLLTEHGSLTFFTGPMASGKTFELVRHLHIFREQQVPLVCLRPSTDNRTPTVQSRDGLLQDAIAVDPQNLTMLTRYLSEAQVIGIDEVQFFTPTIIQVLEQALRQGKTLLVAGLDADFRGLLFPAAQAIMSLPETIVSRSRAVCAVCHRYNATRTQRLRNGQPVFFDDPLVLIEHSAKETTYEARCLEHHVVLPAQVESLASEVLMERETVAV